SYGVLAAPQSISTPLDEVLKVAGRSASRRREAHRCGDGCFRLLCPRVTHTKPRHSAGGCAPAQLERKGPNMSDILGYKGKRVIVSGCFSGMGEATARMLIDLGAEVHGFDYKDVSLPLASFNKVDLRDPQSIEAGVAAVGGKIDALFNCAG